MRLVILSIVPILAPLLGKYLGEGRQKEVEVITFCVNRSIKVNANIACCPVLPFISYIIVLVWYLFSRKG